MKHRAPQPPDMAEIERLTKAREAAKPKPKENTDLRPALRARNIEIRVLREALRDKITTDWYNHDASSNLDVFLKREMDAIDQDIERAKEADNA